MGTRESYTWGEIALHWATAALILGAWLASDDMGRVLERRIEEGWTGTEGNTLHVWLGGAALLAVIARLTFRLIRGVPAPLTGAKGLRIAAEWGHRLIYLLAAAVPVLGAATWYGRIEPLGEIHEAAAGALMLLVLGHAGFAIWHSLRGQNTLRRMLRPGG